MSEYNRFTLKLYINYKILNFFLSDITFLYKPFSVHEDEKYDDHWHPVTSPESQLCYLTGTAPKETSYQGRESHRLCYPLFPE